jgi:hypothetical protein
MKKILCETFLLLVTMSVSPLVGQQRAAASANTIDIQTAHGTSAETQTKMLLQSLIRKYDLSKYTFTDKVVIEQGAMNHSFPVITLNVRFRDLPDNLLSSYVHEQIHWYLRDHNEARLAAIDELEQKYPNAPTEYPAGGGSKESTYGHLITCYLEMQADRQLIGEKRTKRVIEQTPWYSWIWKTVVNDEPAIAAVVKEQHLEMQ